MAKEVKKVITQEDLDNNPDLKEQGVQVGEEVTFSEETDENGNPLPEDEEAASDPASGE